MINFEKLAVAVRAKRGNRSIREAAEEAGIPFPTLGRVEQGKPCDLGTFVAVCNWIGVPMDYFRTEGGETEPADEPEHLPAAA